jgi:hypothetical protein
VPSLVQIGLSVLELLNLSELTSIQINTDLYGHNFNFVRDMMMADWALFAGRSDFASYMTPRTRI